MPTFGKVTLTAILLGATAGLAFAQSAPDHMVHHDAQPASPASDMPQAGTPMPDRGETQEPMGMMGSGMMSGGMAPMMQMMQGMTEMMQGMMRMMQAHGQSPAPSGMMTGAMMEERLAAVKSELGITEAQSPQWNAFAEALRGQMRAMHDMRRKMMMQKETATPWPDRLAEHERGAAAHLEAMKAMEEPVNALWQSLSEEQRRKASETLFGPPGGM